ncbi:MAG: hypothetical protein LBV71_07825 [Prevotella sp.]|jgi:hypothetical protein|nr:hypothetical protein [Prevotella sp.]
MRLKANKTKLLPALILLVVSIFALPVQAQVTIGDGETPVSGALLQLKDKTGINDDGANATKGLSFPRVNLSQKNKLYPMFEDTNTPQTSNAEYLADTDGINKKHTGLMVYNMYTSAEAVTDENLVFHEGFYYWDGEKWKDMGAGGTGECIEANVPFTGGLTSPIVAVLGTSTGVTTMAIAGNGTVANLGIDVNLVGIDLLNLDLEDLGLSSPIIAASDGWLSEISIDMAVTASVALTGRYDFNATLYEAQAGSGTYKKVSEAVVKIFENEGGGIAIVPTGSLSKTQSFVGSNIPITKGNKYAILFTLKPSGGLNLLGTIDGTISGNMSIGCNNGSTSSAIEPWLVSGTTDQATVNTDNIYQMGQVTIGNTATAEPSAALNVDAGNKGVLFPKVALTGTTDKLTIPNPATGLFVYNTGANTNFRTVGYMFWDGEKWKLFTNATADEARAELHCEGVAMSPGQQVRGGVALLSGSVLQIPYSGSNGGSFNGVVLRSEGNNNVTASIDNGMLAVGNGVLNFSLAGVPISGQEAPNGIRFDLTPFFDANPNMLGCEEVIVGHIMTADISEAAVMGYMQKASDEDGNTVWAVTAQTPDGKYSVRVRLNGSATSVAFSNQQLNVQVRNNTSNDAIVIWNYDTQYSGDINTNGVFTMPAQEWGGVHSGGADANWYNETEDDNAAYWGNIGIYDGVSGPEYRRYTWIPGGGNNVAYEAKIMAAIDNLNPTTAVSPSRLKVYIKIEQVTAVQ